MLRNRQHVAQQAVNALPDVNVLFLRFDVDVARTGLGRLAQDQVDEPDDRRQVDVFGQRGDVDEFVVGVRGGLDFSLQGRRSPVGRRRWRGLSAYRRESI